MRANRCALFMMPGPMDTAASSEAALSHCPICRIHSDVDLIERYEIQRDALWVLRHHADPAPLPGWLLLDSVRRVSGPIDFNEEECADWGRAVRGASALVKMLTGCDRVYAIAFGEGAQHLHLHLIPRFIEDSRTPAWSVADHYRAVEQGERAAAPPDAVQDMVKRARQIQG